MIWGLVFTGTAQEDLPEGKGKETLEHTCTECHGLDKVVDKLRSPKQWRVIVTRMRAAGATMTDSEFSALLDYLVEYFGDESAEKDPQPEKINVNRATAKDLETSLQIASKDAAAIVRHREANGVFKQLQDLMKVEGIDKTRIDACKDRIAF